jgi:uncharacterized protein (TIGR02646 family)
VNVRPVRRRASPQKIDFANYRDAFPELRSRLGPYCSYCERKIVTMLHVEHIQPKSLSQYSHLEGCWDNFLLACVNCNTTKQDKDVILDKVLLPDRDNTAVAFKYQPDGTVIPNPKQTTAIQTMANTTLSLTGLDKPISEVHDENGKLVAIDRVSQRMEAWLMAEAARDDIDENPTNAAILRGVIRTATENGLFSVWMEVFVNYPNVRQALIDAFPGTKESQCFDAQTLPVSPAPNLDQLTHGNKS